MTQLSAEARAAKRAYMQDYWERKAKGQLRTYTRPNDDPIDQMCRDGLTYEEYIRKLTDENAALTRKVAVLEAKLEAYQDLTKILKSKTE